MLSLTYIYAHLEPDSDEIRYIGKSNNPRRRMVEHRSRAAGRKDHLSNWVNSLRTSGTAPRVEILAEVPVEEWQFWERHYIKYFRECGFDLVNSTVGGEGLCNPSEGTRAKMRAAKSGAKHPWFGRKHTPEWRAEMSRRNRGSGNPMFGRLGEKSPFFGVPPCPAAIAASVASRKGRPLSLETRAKLSEARAGEKNHMFGKTGERYWTPGRLRHQERRAGGIS